MRFFLHTLTRIRVVNGSLEWSGTPAAFQALEPQYPGLPSGALERYQTPDRQVYLDATGFHPDTFDALPYTLQNYLTVQPPPVLHRPRFVATHDDMIGFMRTAVTGASQTTPAQIRDTGFILEWLMNNADDYHQLLIQVPHWRKLGSQADSLHLHYMADLAPLAGDTAFFDYAYCWISPGSNCPALTGWQAGTSVLTFAGNEGAWFYDIFPITAPVTPPPGEGYGGLILLKMIRNATGTPSDTYAGNIGIFALDAHSPKDRMGSKNEASD